MRIRQGITAAHNLLLQSAALDFPAWQPGAPLKATCELQAEQVCRGGEWLEVGMAGREVLSTRQLRYLTSPYRSPKNCKGF